MTGSKYDKMVTKLIFNKENIGVFIALFILIFPLFLNLSKYGKRQFRLLII